MKIHFRLAWIHSGAAGQRAFKSKAVQSLFLDYTQRISKFAACYTTGIKGRTEARTAGIKVWLCDRGPDARMLSSEELAARLGKCRDSGTRELQIVIGGPGGFSKKELGDWKPDLKWSFGPLTLPHELAAGVAGEQIYRAFTLLHRLPYHLGHS